MLLSRTVFQAVAISPGWAQCVCRDAAYIFAVCCGARGVAPLEAAIVAQSVARMVRDAARARKYRKTITNAALRIQPVWRGFKGRQYAKWVREVTWAAVDLQKMTRGFLARCAFKRAVAEKHHNTVIVPAADDVTPPNPDAWLRAIA